MKRHLKEIRDGKPLTRGGAEEVLSLRKLDVGRSSNLNPNCGSMRFLMAVQVQALGWAPKEVPDHRNAYPENGHLDKPIRPCRETGSLSKTSPKPTSDLSTVKHQQTPTHSHHRTKKMIQNFAAVIRKSPLYYRSAIFSPKLTSRAPNNNAMFPGNPFRITTVRSFSPYQSCPFTSSSSHASVYKIFWRSELRLLPVGMDYIRVSAVSDRGSGGSGGTGGGSSGGGGYGGSGEDSNSSNWSLISWYLGLLEKFPVMTKAVTSALLTLIGDLICQLTIDQVPSLDYKRTFLFTLLGLVLVGPTLHFWYLYLSKLVTLPGASGAFLRLLLDQFIFSPIFIGVFLSTLITLEGRPSLVVPKLQQEWFSSVLANWQLWIPFQFLNFRFVPQQFQVLAANFVALIWNVILSFKAHKEILWATMPVNMKLVSDWANVTQLMRHACVGVLFQLTVVASADLISDFGCDPSKGTPDLFFISFGLPFSLGIFA
ncbi:hypothetical protein Nepgr_022073 [Nepenthes gracilis]|uniref:Uncharacterized protein n=1 Tax=Nepenthes gracilis TaxID=150966 RepID=A0AAD3XWG8_NEPGR|nr:hypothetical protein Nepgr_022073 [Nepenthes gracilis]